MALRINDTVPNLYVTTDEGEFYLHDFIGDQWTILFSHPKDFTPVCSTEFSVVAQLTQEWEKRRTRVIGLSVDGIEEHKRWKVDIEKIAGTAPMFPIIADEELVISKALDMLPAYAKLPSQRTPSDSQTVRNVYIISPDKRVQLSLCYPMSVGRNFAEIVRALDALQATYQTPIATPANWEVGHDVIVSPNLDDQQARDAYGEINFLLPYLRTVRVTPE